MARSAQPAEGEARRGRADEIEALGSQRLEEPDGGAAASDRDEIEALLVERPSRFGGELCRHRPSIDVVAVRRRQHAEAGGPRLLDLAPRRGMPAAGPDQPATDARQGHVLDEQTE